MLKKAAIIAVLGVACACASNQTVSVTVTEEVISSGYIGNGAEWDPYDEVLSWGSQVSEEDWNKLFSRLDFMRMGYVRCMINSPFTYYDAQTGTYDKDRNIESLKKLLGYCQKNGIYVIFGEYNPPAWEMKDSQRWIDMSVDFLDHLVSDLGFTCIRNFVIFNEPDGSWASTNGDYDLWLSTARRFWDKMNDYDGLKGKVTLAGPDVVMDYHNPASEYDAEGWMSQSSKDIDGLIGVYDVHSYPGQTEVRDGSYSEKLRRIRAVVPQDKKVILGEAGYKYQSDPKDSLLWQEYQRRCADHSYTKGSDCNMLVYDYFYGLDMPLLAMEVMNNGFSGLAAWMLDDSMHSSGDSGKTEDLKIWGMWNILGEEVFSDASQEEVRPWYYTWSLMCRFFPAGTDVLKVRASEDVGLRYVSGVRNGEYSLAAVNVSDVDRTLEVTFPAELDNASLYLYQEDNLKTEGEFPAPVETGLGGSRFTLDLPSGTFVLLTEMN